MVGSNKQLKTAEIFKQIDLLDHSGRGYIQGFPGFSERTQVCCFDKCIILFYSLTVWAFGGQMLGILGSSGQTLDFSGQYLFWTVVIGGLPTVLNLVLANIVRAQGKAKISGIGMSLGGVLNIILDPIFIFTL